MLKLSIEAENGKDLREQLEALLGIYGGTKEIEVEVKPTRKKKEEPAKEEPAKEEPAKEEPAKEEPAKEEPAKGAVTKDVVIQAVLERGRAGKKAEIKALLGEFGAERVPNLKDSDYPAFYEKLMQL